MVIPNLIGLISRLQSASLIEEGRPEKPDPRKGGINQKKVEKPITYRYFINTSNTSAPPSLPHILFNSGVISLALMPCRTSVTVCKCASFTASSPPYGALSSAPRSAPSASPPRRSCRTCWPSVVISAWDTGANGACSVEVSKLVDVSGSRASMFMVRQFSAREASLWCWTIDIVDGDGEEEEVVVVVDLWVVVGRL